MRGASGEPPIVAAGSGGGAGLRGAGSRHSMLAVRAEAARGVPAEGRVARVLAPGRSKRGRPK